MCSMTAAEQNHRLTEVKCGNICLGVVELVLVAPILLCKLQATEQLWARLQLVNITKKTTQE